eukprot:6208229-Pleurochrysis_carterae.AAC.1
MLSRWRRRAHHPHRRMFVGRALWMNMRNGGRTCQLAWRPWRLAPDVSKKLGLVLSSRLVFR